MIDPLLFESVDEETPETELPVTGEIPGWLHGTLLRNGPAKFELGSGQLRHWFDGFAMLHKFQIADGKVTYKSRFLETEDWVKNKKAGKIMSRHWGTTADPCASIFTKFFSAFQKPKVSNTNVSFVKLPNKIAATSDFSTLVEFDFDSLETLHKVDFQDKMGNDFQFSASHHAYDPLTQEYFNVLGQPGPRGRFTVVKMQGENFDRKPIATIQAPKHTYFHSMGLTQHYVVFIEQPMRLHIWKLLFSRLLDAPTEKCYQWQPEAGVRVHLIHRETGEVKTIPCNPFFFFHTLNSFEEGDNLYVDLFLYQNPNVVKELYLDSLKEKGIPVEDLAKIHRMTIDLTTNTLTLEEKSSIYSDLGTFNFDKTCQPYRYAYALGYNEEVENDVFNEIVKFDLETGHTQRTYEKGHYPSEPLFVAAPDAVAEDEGVVLSVVLDIEKGNSYLSIRRAQDLREIARAHAPVRLPVGLHGMYYA